jgi:rSAM/selenodomain-associated transferase 1
MSPTTAIALVCKTPAIGRGKSRLWPLLGPARTAQLSACFIRDLVETLAALPASLSRQCYALFSPAGTETALRKLLTPDWQLIPREADDVGQVLEVSLKALLQAGHDGVIFMNGDSPSLPGVLIEEAINALRADGDRVVLGPSLDGGYYLIGLKRFHAALFRDIAWSTPAVFTETYECAVQMGLPVYVLHEWYDVDEADDFDRLTAEFGGQVPFADSVVKAGPARHTRALLAVWTAMETAPPQQPSQD